MPGFQAGNAMFDRAVTIAIWAMLLILALHLFGFAT